VFVRERERETKRETETEKETERDSDSEREREREEELIFHTAAITAWKMSCSSLFLLSLSLEYGKGGPLSRAHFPCTRCRSPASHLLLVAVTYY
jgi:hypothetical protein